MLELGFAYMSSLPFWSVANDVLKELADSLTGFCLIVATDSSYDHVCGWCRQCGRPTRRMFVEFPDIGRRAPIHMVAPGIILLGALTGQDLNRALLACTASDTEVSLPALRERVIRDRRAGLVVSLGARAELLRDRRAAPRCAGAHHRRHVSAQPTLEDLGRATVKQYLPRIKQAAEEINRLVGYRAP